MEAVQRKQDRLKRSVEQQLSLINKRPGSSVNEYARLVDLTTKEVVTKKKVKKHKTD